MMRRSSRDISITSLRSPDYKHRLAYQLGARLRSVSVFVVPLSSSFGTTSVSDVSAPKLGHDKELQIAANIRLTGTFL